MAVTPQFSRLTWFELVNRMVGKDILLMVRDEDGRPLYSFVGILGTQELYNEVALVVDDEDDVKIILHDGKGVLWDAYEDLSEKDVAVMEL